MKSVKERLYEYFCRIFRREIIRDGFRGVFGREPEEEALRAYAKSYKELGTDGLIKELSGSLEAWEKQKGSHAEELIREAYQGVLGRDPEAEALKEYATGFKELGTGRVIRELSASAEAWEKQKGKHAEELIRILYRGILLREADAVGLAGKAEKIRNQLPWEEIIRELLHSPEFLSKHQSVLKSATKDPWDDLVEEMSDYCGYHEFLHKKAPDRKEIIAFLASGKKIWDLKRERLAELLIAPESVMLLLIGAYGNGNLGDAYQALAVQQQIMDRYSIPKENIYAASHNNVAAFPFAPDRTVSREKLMDPGFVNGFDLIVIGGGGLFAHPHAPFRDFDKWAQNVHAPIIIHAVGATKKNLKDCGILIRKAIEASFRDEESISAIKEFRSDCRLENDPILAITSIEGLEQYDGPSVLEKVGELTDCLWVLKYPADDKDRKSLETIREIIAEDKRSRHQIVAIEPERDRELDNWFPGKVYYCTLLKELNQFIRQSEKVISMRYHGAIFGKINGKITYGFSQTKIKSILKSKDYYLDHISKTDYFKSENNII